MYICAVVEGEKVCFYAPRDIFTSFFCCILNDREVGDVGYILRYKELKLNKWPEEIET